MKTFLVSLLPAVLVQSMYTIAWLLGTISSPIMPWPVVLVVVAGGLYILIPVGIMGSKHYSDR